MIVFGTRTKREGRGFVLRQCLHCRTERVHFVAQSTSKFTLYFVPTFTTSNKALLVCTECEWTSEVGGPEARRAFEEAVPQAAMIRRLEQQAATAGAQARAGESGSTGGASEPLALGTVLFAMTAALADGDIEDNETAAIAQAIETIAKSTRSEPMRAAADSASENFMDFLTYAVSPVTPPVPVMFASVGAASRHLADDDRSRFVGQLAWLGQVVSNAASLRTEEALAATDRAFAQMGYTAREVADALAFCEAHGG